MSIVCGHASLIVHNLLPNSVQLPSIAMQYRPVLLWNVNFTSGSFPYFQMGHGPVSLSIAKWRVHHKIKGSVNKYNTFEWRLHCTIFSDMSWRICKEHTVACFMDVHVFKCLCTSTVSVLFNRSLWCQEYFMGSCKLHLTVKTVTRCVVL